MNHRDSGYSCDSEESKVIVNRAVLVIMVGFFKSFDSGEPGSVDESGDSGNFCE